MTDTTTTTTPPAPTASPSPAPSFVQRRASQEGPPPSKEPPWQTGRSAESKHVAAHQAAEEARQQQLRDQVQPSTPGAPPAATSGERYKVGKYELSEAEVGELITTKAAEDSRKLTLPTSAEKYEPTLPADFVSPPGIAAAIDTKDPLFAQAQQFAHRHHLSQDQFSDLLGVYAGQQVEREMFLAKARAAEAAKLGPAASQRVASVQQFLKGQIGSELAAEVNMMLVTSGAVRAIEVLMAKFTNQGSAAFSQAGRAPPDAPGSIPGYESMNFIQRRAAQDAALQRRR